MHKLSPNQHNSHPNPQLKHNTITQAWFYIVYLLPPNSNFFFSAKSVPGIAYRLYFVSATRLAAQEPPLLQPSPHRWSLLPRNLNNSKDNKKHNVIYKLEVQKLFEKPDIYECRERRGKEFFVILHLLNPLRLISVCWGVVTALGKNNFHIFLGYTNPLVEPSKCYEIF